MSLHQFLRLPSIFQPDRRCRRKALLAAAAMSIVSCSGARAADGDVNEALLKKLETMEQRIQSLEAELKQKKAPAAEKQAPLPKSRLRCRQADLRLRKATQGAHSGSRKRAPAPWHGGGPSTGPHWLVLAKV